MFKKHSLIILVAFIITFLLYRFIFNYGFFQDDFILLHDFQINQLADIFKIFIPQNTIYYRPFGNGLFFGLLSKLFTHYAQLFHLLALILHCSAGLLLAKLIKKITNSDLVAIISLFGYLTSAVHFMSLIWIGQLPFLLGVIFYLLTVLLSIQSKEKIPLWFIFTLGLLTHELVLLAPLTWLVLTIAYPRKFSFSWLKVFKYWWPAGLYLIFRLIIFPISLGGSYQPDLGKSTLSALAWYLLWLFNLPEELKYQTVISQLKIMPKFVLNFWNHLTIWVSGFSLIVFQIFILPLIVRIKFHHHYFTALGFMVVSLAPLLISPKHQYPFYLAFALPGFLLFAGVQIELVLKKINSLLVKRLYLGSIAMTWLILSYLTINFTKLTHWTIQEAKRVSHYQEELKGISLPPGPLDIVVKDDYQVKESLADQLGPRFLTSNSQITTHYLSPDEIIDFVPWECVVFSQKKNHLVGNHRECLAPYKIFVLN